MNNLLMATEMVSTTVFFPIKKLFLRNEKLNKMRRCLLKNYTAYFLKSIQVSFQAAFFKLGFTPWKTKQPLKGMESREKEAQKD